MREAFAKRDGRGLSLFDDEQLRETYTCAKPPCAKHPGASPPPPCTFRTFPLDGHVLTLCAGDIPRALAPEPLLPETWHNLITRSAEPDA